MKGIKQWIGLMLGFALFAANAFAVDVLSHGLRNKIGDVFKLQYSYYLGQVVDGWVYYNVADPQIDDFRWIGVDETDAYNAWGDVEKAQGSFYSVLNIQWCTGNMDCTTFDYDHIVQYRSPEDQ